jgi:hypothetical protein
MPKCAYATKPKGFCPEKRLMKHRFGYHADYRKLIASTTAIRNLSKRMPYRNSYAAFRLHL